MRFKGGSGPWGRREGESYSCYSLLHPCAEVLPVAGFLPGLRRVLTVLSKSVKSGYSRVFTFSDPFLTSRRNLSGPIGEIPCFQLGFSLSDSFTPVIHPFSPLRTLGPGPCKPQLLAKMVRKGRKTGENLRHPSE